MKVSAALCWRQDSELTASVAEAFDGLDDGFDRHISLDIYTPVGMVVVTEKKAGVLKKWQLELLQNGVWTPVKAREEEAGRVHILRFPQRTASAARVRFLSWEGKLAIAEIGVYKK